MEGKLRNKSGWKFPLIYGMLSLGRAGIEHRRKHSKKRNFLISQAVGAFTLALLNRRFGD